MANTATFSGLITSGSPQGAFTNNPNFSGLRDSAEFSLIASPNAANQPLTLNVTVNISGSSRDTYLEIVQGLNLVADSDNNGTSFSPLIAPGQPSDDPGNDNSNVPNSLNLTPLVNYRVRLLTINNNNTDFRLDANIPQGDIVLISRSTAFTLTRPTADSNTNGENTGVTPTNAASGEFFNLSDLSDNVTLDGARGIVRGLAGRDRIQGFTGNDLINGNGGADTILGEPGNDDVRGGAGSDSLLGGVGDDSVFGNNNNDTLEGGDGNDLLRGGRDSDILIGNEGNDTLIGDLGFDVLTGGAGTDLFVIRGGEAASTMIASADLIVDFAISSDRIGLTDNLNFSELAFIPTAITFDRVALNSTAVYHIPTASYLGTFYGITPEAFNTSLFITTTF
jgi:Ca2+-binding RTX toxin-like protein